MAFTLGVSQFKSAFFDTDAVLKEMDRAQRKILSRFGAYTRTRIRSSLRYARGKSKPGRPPNVHTTSSFSKEKRDKKTGTVKKQAASPLRELIFFAYDGQAKSVVVGPAKFGGRGGIVPRLLEFGGSGSFTDSRTGEIKRGVWAPRPFVNPAAEEEIRSGKFLTG